MEKIAKEETREKMRKLRDLFTVKEQIAASAKIAANLFSLEEVKSAKHICFYLPKGSEVDTKPMIALAIGQGKKISVPITNEHIELAEFDSFERLRPGKFGIPEPSEVKKISIAPEAIIVPGLAFDKDFHRIGYGKGYYDRLLKELKSFRIGVCYELQLMELFPRHEHDQQLDAIVTEKIILRR